MHLARADTAYFARLVTPPPVGWWVLARHGVAPPGPKTGTVLDVEAAGFVGRGAWRVLCPFCGGCQFGDPNTQTRFMCCDCGNVDVRGSWVPVRWPVDVAAVEKPLVARRRPDRMHWQPHETVAWLWAENVTHGVSRVVDAPKDIRHDVYELLGKSRSKPGHVVARGVLIHPASELVGV